MIQIKRRGVSFRLTERRWQKLDKVAQLRERSKTSLIEDLIDQLPNPKELEAQINDQD